MYQDAWSGAEAICSAALEVLSAKADGDLFAVNSLSSVRDDVIWFSAPEGVRALKDPNGQISPVQYVEGKACAYVKGLPPMSGKAFCYVTDHPGVQEEGCFSRNDPENCLVRAGSSGFETPFFTGVFDASMRIISMTDRRNGRELCKPGQALNRIVCYENRPHNYDAWDINIYYDRRSWEVTDVQSVTVISEGPVLTCLRVHYRFNRSDIWQDLIFYRDLDRVDFVTTVDWREAHYMLKAHFPVDVFYNEATYDIQYGNVKRPAHKNTSWDAARFEVCAHKWADVSEADYGFSLMNDCKYGYSVDEDSMALTLLKSSTYPNPEADQERHFFTYSIMPHTGDWRAAGIPAAAYRLNIPVITVPGRNRSSSSSDLPPFVQTDRDNVIVETVKRQMDGEDTIIRVYECYGARSEAVMTFGFTPRSVKTANLMEDVLGEIVPEGNQIRFFIRPYEILTFLVKY